MDYKKIGLDKLGFKGKHQIYRNLPVEKIIEHSLLNKETQHQPIFKPNNLFICFI